MRGLPSIGAAILAVGLAACASAPTGPQELTVTAVDLAYEPETLEVMAGRPVILTMVNEGAIEHDFSIMEIHVEAVGEVHEEEMEHEMGGMDPELHFAAHAGETSSLEFTPTEAGSYEFFCSVAGHKEAGMVGTLVVKAR